MGCYMLTSFGWNALAFLPEVLYPSKPLNVIVISYEGAELVFEDEALTFAGADDGSFMVTPFKALVLNVEFDFKIDLIVFSLETGFCTRPISLVDEKEYSQTKDYQLNHSQLLKSQ
ncbi:hypothetical protein Tco_0766112 [Tanacetum coccineum]